MAVKMVDIHAKDVVYREAVAEGKIILRPETVALIRAGKVEKGDPVQIATLAGIQASKFTSLLMPLCHPLKIESTDVRVEVEDWGVKVSAKVAATEKTGVEMEALTSVATALLNIWDVVKMYEKDKDGQYPYTAIKEIRVVSKVKRKI
ncbi:MAG: cyclic pyranopterin monophosphate synthase MoaC [Nitrososphaerales archaeon]